MKGLLTKLARIDLKVDEDISNGVLLKSLPSEYDHVVTTLNIMPASKLVEVKASLLEEGRKLRTKSPMEPEYQVCFGGKGCSGTLGEELRPTPSGV